MLKCGAKLALALAVLLTPTLAVADLTLTISDGTTTLSVPRNNFVRLSVPVSKTVPSTTSIGLLSTLNTCNAAGDPAASGTFPCAVGFPSGQRPPASTDTFSFRDHGATSKATLLLNLQSTTAQVTLTNVKIKSLVAGRTLTLTYRTAAGDLPTVSTAGKLPATVALSGAFQTSTGLRASGCALTSNPCIRSTLKINTVTLNGVGSNLSTFLTASIPCAATDASAPCSPPGGSGSWNASLGNFTGVSDSGDVSCGTLCSPVYEGTVTTRFSGANETLTLTGSSTGAGSLVGAEDPNSLIGILTAVRSEFTETGLEPDLFVAYTSADSTQYRVTPAPPLTNETRNLKNSSTIPLTFYLSRASLALADTLALVSIGCDDLPFGNEGSCQRIDDVPLPSATRSNNGAYLTFIPANLLFKDLSTLELFYEFQTFPLADPPGTGPSGDPRVGDVVFSDCAAGSFRLDILLVDPKTGVERTARVYLGNDPATSYRSGCATSALSGANIVADAAARVDTSEFQGGRCCVTFDFAKKGNLSSLQVRAISVVVDQGFGLGAPTFANYNVRVGELDNIVVVNGVSATGKLATVEPDYRQVSELPQDGTFMRVTKLSVTDPNTPCTGLGGDPCPTVVRIVPSTAISTSGGKFSTSVNVNDLLPTAGGTRYAVEMCLFGSPSKSPPTSAPGTPSYQTELHAYYQSFQGTCPITVGRMTLR